MQSASEAVFYYFFDDLLAFFLVSAFSSHATHTVVETKSDEYAPEIRPKISGTEKLRSEVYPLANTTIDTISIVPSVVIVVLTERVSDCVQPVFVISLSEAFGISDLFSLILS